MIGPGSGAKRSHGKWEGTPKRGSEISLNRFGRLSINEISELRVEPR